MSTLTFNCEVCGNLRINKKAEPSTRYCSRKCYHIALKGRISPRKGAVLSKETKEKLSIAHLRVNKLRGKENHPSYKKDRSLLKRQDRGRSTYPYLNWRRKVCERDFDKCRLANIECKGRMEVHHIFPWREYPGLRYEVSNGITLCKYHHPRGSKKEKAFQEKFKRLVNINNK